MNKRNRLTAAALALASVVVMMTGCGGASGQVGVKTSGSTMTVTQEANPTTGYSWTVEIEDPSVIELTDDTYKSSDAELGSGGVEIFTFKARSEGTTHIYLTYGQHWEGGTTDSVTTVTVQVEGSKIVNAGSVTESVTAPVTG
ncbi:MAG: protease inhibitor I42 family protein [Lachnospiraceae bacterium]|nr:protease inhibitor I42 family protein [Lachnospiraceae bacterium]